MRIGGRVPYDVDGDNNVAVIDQQVIGNRVLRFSLPFAEPDTLLWSARAARCGRKKVRPLIIVRLVRKRRRDNCLPNMRCVPFRLIY